MSGPGKGADPKAFTAALNALQEGQGLESLLNLARPSKAAFRATAAALESPAGAQLRTQLADQLQLSHSTSAEKLLRLASGRAVAAQARSNPIARNESFNCLHCGLPVPPAPGSKIRNHCPRCLRSLHVDGDVPGDRQSNCHGIMDPSAPELSKGSFRVTHRCRRCGHERRNRLYPDWQIAPDQLAGLWPSK